MKLKSKGAELEEVAAGISVHLVTATDLRPSQFSGGVLLIGRLQSVKGEQWKGSVYLAGQL